ncbi:MAG: hypothetical protein ACLFPW_14525 [Spirochaetaceae bacterium]
MNLKKKPLQSALARARAGRALIVAVTGLIGVALLGTVTGCGGDGSDGKAHIAYTWLYGPISFYTEDPAFETQTHIYNGEFRQSRAGTWYFEYVAWDDSYWFGEYEIYINEGESGGLFSEGEDGADLYFELAAYSFGPSFYVWDSPDYVTAGASSLVAAAGAGVAEAVSPAEVGGARRSEIREAEAAGVETTAAKGGRAERRERLGEPGELSAGAATHVIEHQRFTLILRYEKGEKR